MEEKVPAMVFASLVQIRERKRSLLNECHAETEVILKNNKPCKEPSDDSMDLSRIEDEVKMALEKKVDEVTAYYKAEKAAAEKIVQDSAAMTAKLDGQRTKLLRQIKEMRKNVAKQQDQILQNKDKHEMDANELKEGMAFARHLYQKVFGLNVHIVCNTENEIIATLMVKEKKFPIKITFDNTISKVIDFDATKIIEGREHAELKAIFQESGDACGLLAALRAKAIAKCTS